MAEKIIRHYNMEDEVMLTRAGTQHALLTTDLAAFTAKFPWITVLYLTSYGTDIDTADAFPQDGTVLTDIRVLTADVNASVAEGRAALQQLFRYAEITYPTDKVKQRVFGQDKMDKARNDQEKMENLLEHAHSMAGKAPYKADLLAKGYTQPQIDNLLTISDNINTKNLLQEGAKANRPVSTQDRINVHNIVFDRMRIIQTCAEEVFAGNAAKIEQYRAYPPTTGEPTTLVVHLMDGGGNDIGGVTVEILNTTIPTEVTDAVGLTGTFQLGSDPPDTVDVQVSGAGIISPSPQTFSNQSILDSEANSIELVVTV